MRYATYKQPDGNTAIYCIPIFSRSISTSTVLADPRLQHAYIHSVGYRHLPMFSGILSYSGCSVTSGHWVIVHSVTGVSSFSEQGHSSPAAPPSSLPTRVHSYLHTHTYKSSSRLIPVVHSRNPRGWSHRALSLI